MRPRHGKTLMRWGPRLAAYNGSGSGGGLANTLLVALLLTGAAGAPGVLDEVRARRFVLTGGGGTG
jgi:hypothetical protein